MKAARSYRPSRPTRIPKNIQELHLEPDKELYQEAHVHLNMSKEKYDELNKKVPLGYYEGIYPNMKDGQVIIDDANHHEVEEMIKTAKPDLFLSGVRDKYIAHKMGVPSKQLHSYDYSGPYAGFNGALNFARDVADMLTTPAWKLIKAPWEDQEIPRSDKNA